MISENLAGKRTFDLPEIFKRDAQMFAKSMQEIQSRANSKRKGREERWKLSTNLWIYIVTTFYSMYRKRNDVSDH